MNADSYIIIIAASLLVGLSYIYDKLSKKLKIPSVLFLIVTGIILKYSLGSVVDTMETQIHTALELLGIIGLIMIVLEAAVDLHISKEKTGLITRSFSMAAVILVVSSFGIAYIIYISLGVDFFNCLIYGIPLSVVSSAVLIPSVHSLTERKREFMIYESTFSDILGIMFFNFIVLEYASGNAMTFTWKLPLTIMLSVAVSYLLVIFFTKLKTGAKLFLMVAILALLYAIGKKLHISSLLIILIFGLVLNNAKIFFRGGLSKVIDFENVRAIGTDFQLVTSETAFIVRTFFFVVFGFSIDLSILLDFTVLSIGTMIVILLYFIRFINFRIFLKADAFPEVFLAPRGLITILLFYSIPSLFNIEGFSVGILFFVILATSIVMMLALIKTPSEQLVDLTHESTNPDSFASPIIELEDEGEEYEEE